MLLSRTGSLATVDEVFLDLVCRDEQLLRDEFDAIIAAGWPTRRPPATPRAVSWPSAPRPARPALPAPECRGGGCSRRPVRRRRRQRSPPEAARTTANHCTRLLDEGR